MCGGGKDKEFLKTGYRWSGKETSDQQESQISDDLNMPTETRKKGGGGDNDTDVWFVDEK